MPFVVGATGKRDKRKRGNAGVDQMFYHIGSFKLAAMSSVYPSGNISQASMIWSVIRIIVGFLIRLCGGPLLMGLLLTLLLRLGLLLGLGLGRLLLMRWLLLGLSLLLLLGGFLLGLSLRVKGRRWLGIDLFGLRLRGGLY